MRHTVRRVATAVLICSLGLTACATEDPGQEGGSRAIEGLRVVEDADSSGIEAVRLLADSAPVLVVAAPDDAAQAVAASVAVGLRAPMATAVPGSEQAISEEVDRLGVSTVLQVGEVGFEVEGPDTVQVSGDRAAVEETTGLEFAQSREVPARDIGSSIADADPSALVFLSSGELSRLADAGVEGEVPDPSSTGWEPGSEPIVLVHDGTSVAAVATAVALGARVTDLSVADPRATGDGVAAVRDAGAVVALGQGWGTEDELSGRIEQAVSVPELPGGGQILFPGRRFVAAYGSPVTPALGILGEQGPAETVRRVQQLVAEYQQFSPETVVPAFEIIGTVAAGEPGPDGNFTNEWSPEVLLPMVDAITEAGGYAVIDLQPGMADMVEQAELYSELLARPGVGLALDPEWKLKPGQSPGAQIGSVDAEEINRVIHWLADLTRDSGGPQKLLILHQFSTAMITGRDRIDTSRPEVALSLHADGHGTPDLKLETWNALLAGLQPEIWPAWKNFYDEDTPTFTPEQTMAVTPRPWFVSYQ